MKNPVISIVIIGVWIILLFGCAINHNLDTSLHKVDVLRVGMTGDYPPITYYDSETDSYSGQAVDMAKQLGKYLGTDVCFVKTSWVTMADDLKSGKFDIAIGGITATPERAKSFLLTNPVMFTGKCPLIRKTDKQKYLSLKDIDKPNVIVVENLGGTNLQFAKNNLRYAKLVVVPENKMAFDYLLQGKADVMFTDNIEAEYRQKIMPELYAVDPGHPYTHTAKVYLINKDNDKLLEKVDQWLKETYE